MAFSITQFENNTTNQLSALDENFTTFGALVPIPCGISGTNVLTLTPSGAGVVPTPAISAYTTNMTFSGIASGSNTSSVTAAVGALPALQVYKDTILGVMTLAGNEIIAGNAISLRYDAALNSNAGGFHLIASTDITNSQISPRQVQINGGATITNFLSGNSPTLTFTATPGWSSQDQSFSVTAALGNGVLLPATGDFMQVNPPSLGATGVDFRGYVVGAGSLSLSSVSIVSCSTVNIRLLNAASASLASNSGIYRWLATRSVP